MITEDQARALFRGDPSGRIDANAVLRAGRRARHRRRAAFSGGALVAAGTAAFAVASTGSEPSVVRPAATATASTKPSASPSPTTTPRRFDAKQIGDAVLLGRYVEDGERRDVVAYFTDYEPPTGERTVMVCAAAVRPNGETVPLGGCQGPALPENGQHVSLLGGDPGAEDEGGGKRGPLGPGFSYSVVGKSVAGGGVYDETGKFHEGRVLGIEDPTLPARILVVSDAGTYFRGIRVWDETGVTLHDSGPWTGSETFLPPGSSPSPVPHGPE